MFLSPGRYDASCPALSYASSPSSGLGRSRLMRFRLVLMSLQGVSNTFTEPLRYLGAVRVHLETYITCAIAGRHIIFPPTTGSPSFPSTTALSTTYRRTPPPSPSNMATQAFSPPQTSGSRTAVTPRASGLTSRPSLWPLLRLRCLACLYVDRAPGGLDKDVSTR